MRFLRKLFRGCWHLCWACVPGCGQMSQGYMKRGISQTIIFSALVFISVFLEIGALAVLVAPLWVYSFFDSYNLRRQIREGLAPEDEFMFGLSDVDSRRLNQIISRRHSLIGWILVVLGLYNFYQILARRFLRFVTELFPWLDWLYSLLVWDMPRIVGTVLIFTLGLWFIRGPKVISEDDPPYTPPKDQRKKAPRMEPTPWTEAEKTFHETPEPQAPDLPENPAEEEIPPVTLTWKSEFDVERFEKEEEDLHDEQ